MVSVSETKTNVKREFVIIKNEWISIIKKFLGIRLLVKNNQEKLFLTYHNGKCINSPVGINTIGKIPSHIAIYLNLPNPQEYSGHCFRRSSATLLANRGSDFLSIKRHGGWKSSAVAEGYIEESVQTKINVAQTLSDPGPSGSSLNQDINEPVTNALSNENTVGVSGVSITSCNNCVFNINIYENKKNG